MSTIKLKKVVFFCLTFLVCNFVHSFAFAQQSKVDSLLRVLASAPKDTVRVNIYNQLFLEYEFVDDQKAGNYLDKALELATRINYKKGIIKSYLHQGYFSEDIGAYHEALVSYNKALVAAIYLNDKTNIANAYNSIGTVYLNTGNYSKALDNYYSCLKIAEEIGRKDIIATAFNNIGNIYYYQSNYPKAIDAYFSCLKTIGESSNERISAVAYNCLGNVYFEQGNYPEALKNHYASLKIREALVDKKGIAFSYNNIGNIYFIQKKYDKALDNYLQSLEIKKEIGDQNGIASSYSNIGNVYFSQENYSEAIKKYEEAISINEAIGNILSASDVYINIASLYIKQKKYSEANLWLSKAKIVAKNIGSRSSLRDIYSYLAVIDSAKGNYKGAYESYKYYTIYEDSIDNEQSRKKIIESQMTYDFEKKEAATKAEQEKKDIIANEALKQKTQQRNYFILAFVLLALLALFIFRGYKQKQKANQIITQQKVEVEKAKHIIEEKNKDITDSINYAQRIQRAMLSDSEELKRLFPESFILFQPKDIVSGDFYFVHENNDCVYIAAADCTGHGVPGAFMSLIGTTKLTDAVAQSVSPSDILMLLNKAIKAALKQTDGNESTRDGMDIALCVVNKQTRVLTFAGANRPLWLIRKNTKEVEEIKATKCAIGGLTSDSQYYESTEVYLTEGDAFYVSTDGYADQFSGKTEKKLMTKKFKEILVDIQSQPMQEQKVFLANFINNWKEGTEQVDDILVIGVRV